MEKKQNKISDLRDHLFNQMERLNDPNCDLEKELKKSNAMVSIGNVIVNSAKVEVDAMKLRGDQQSDFIPDQKQIGDGTAGKKK